MDYCCTASAEKMKREKALEALKKSRERQAGELPEKSSLDNNYDNEGSVLPKVLTATVAHQTNILVVSFSGTDPAVL